MKNEGKDFKKINYLDSKKSNFFFFYNSVRASTLKNPLSECSWRVFLCVAED